MQSYKERISQRHLLQPFRRASDKCGHEPSVVLPDLRFGKVFRHSIIDSTPLRSCHIKREHSHKTMRGWAEKDKCTMGWFYGFKLHLVINDRGEIIQWLLTPGNVDDREPLKDKEFTKKLFG